MSCILRFGGQKLNVDELKKSSKLQIVDIYHAGDLNPWKKNAPNLKSGGNIIISTADITNLRDQIRDAVEFLANNENDLKFISGFPGLEELTLDFSEQRGEKITQFINLPANLIEKAGKIPISIELSLYPVKD